MKPENRCADGPRRFFARISSPGIDRGGKICYNTIGYDRKNGKEDGICAENGSG